MKFIMVSLAALVFICPLDSFGECLKGDCVNGQGTMSFVHGEKYTGQFKNGQLHGHGTLVTSDGTKYIGSFKDNDFSTGKLYNERGRLKYRGAYKNRLLNGKGTEYFQDGSEWTGIFLNGRKHGTGLFKDPQGKLWKVDFQDDKRVK